MEAVDAAVAAVQLVINATGLDILLGNVLKEIVATNVMAQGTLLVIARMTTKTAVADTTVVVIVEIAVTVEVEVDKHATRVESLVTFQETAPQEEVVVVEEDVAAAVVEETVTTAGSQVISAASAQMNVNRTCLSMQLRYHVIF